VLRSGIASNLL